MPWIKAFFIAVILIFVGNIALEPLWGASSLSSSESWLIRETEEDSSEAYMIMSVGRIVGFDQTVISVENDFAGGADSYPLITTFGIILTPPLDTEESKQLCEAIYSNKGGKDYLWFRNGDETSCEILELNRRFLIFRAFGAVIKAPRYRVKALSFGR